MNERLEPIPRLDTSTVPDYLQGITLVAEELITQSVTAPELFVTPPKTQQSKDAFRAFWELRDEGSRGYEKLAIHLAMNSLTIAHEHRHKNPTPEIPYIGTPPKEYLRSTLVIHKGKAALFHAGLLGPGPAEYVTDSESSQLFTQRVSHALGVLGIELFTPTVANQNRSVSASAASAS